MYLVEVIAQNKSAKISVGTNEPDNACLTFDNVITCIKVILSKDQLRELLDKGHVWLEKKEQEEFEERMEALDALVRRCIE